MENNSNLKKSFKFDLPSHKKPIIKVIGIGGGGGNAVNHMYNKGITDVEFIVCNTDLQDLSSSPIPNKLQIGANLTDGLGAGGNPETGKEAANESIDEINEMFENNIKMVFITAGMGGGTGTGGAPIFAKEAKDKGILTIAIVTTPFKAEGKEKAAIALNGINELKNNVDAIIVVSNEKMREIYGNSTITEGFAYANNILTTAAKSIAEIITVSGIWNVDFADVNTMMKNSGVAMIASATKEGENKAMKAVEAALKSPLLNDNDIRGAKNILVSISYGTQEPTIDEVTDEISEYIRSETGVEVNAFKIGLFADESLGDKLCVTVIATGFGQINETERKIKIIDIDSKKQITMFDNDPEIKNPYIHSHEQIGGNKYKDEDKDEQITEPDKEVKPLFNHDEEFKIVEKSIKDQPYIDTTNGPELNTAKKKQEERLKNRVRKLKSLTNLSMDSVEFKNMLDVPAYIRREIKLQDTPHSSETEISRFTLNEDNELLGDNKFWHDKPD